METKSVLLPDGNFVFIRKANARGERALYLRYYIKGEPALVSTKISIPEEDWDQKKQKVKPRNPEHARLNNRLKVSKRTLQRYRTEKKLTYFMIGHKTFYRAGDVKEFVRRQESYHHLRTLAL